MSISKISEICTWVVAWWEEGRMAFPLSAFLKTCFKLTVGWTDSPGHMPTSGAWMLLPIADLSQTSLPWMKTSVQDWPVRQGRGLAWLPKDALQCLHLLFSHWFSLSWLRNSFFLPTNRLAGSVSKCSVPGNKGQTCCLIWSSWSFRDSSTKPPCSPKWHLDKTLFQLSVLAMILTVILWYRLFAWFSPSLTLITKTKFDLHSLSCYQVMYWQINFYLHSYSYCKVMHAT